MANKPGMELLLPFTGLSPLHFLIIQPKDSPSKNHNIYDYNRQRQLYHKEELPNQVRFLFFISRSAPISSTESLLVNSRRGVPVTARTKTFICLYCRKLEGIVQMGALRLAWASRLARRAEIYLFSFSTFVAHRKLAKVYSWPQYIWLCRLILSYILWIFWAISAAFPQKNLPIPPTNRVSPVKVQDQDSKSLTFLPQIVTASPGTCPFPSYSCSKGRKLQMVCPLVWQGTCRVLTLLLPITISQSIPNEQLAPSTKLRSCYPMTTFTSGFYCLRSLYRLRESPAWSQCLCVYSTCEIRV